VITDVLFESMDMKDGNAQKQAFANTWTNISYMDELHMLAEMHKDLYDAEGSQERRLH
jgi:hypothetical protein